jgi:hypothetical protein
MVETPSVVTNFVPVFAGASSTAEIPLDARDFSKRE